MTELLAGAPFVALRRGRVTEPTTGGIRRLRRRESEAEQSTTRTAASRAQAGEFYGGPLIIRPGIGRITAVR